MCQAASLSLTNPTPDNKLQQAAALAALAGGAPDQLTDASKTLVASITVQLVSQVTGSERSTIVSVLSTLGSLTSQALLDSTGSGNGGRRLASVRRYERGLAGASTAQTLVDQTNAAIDSIVTGVLSGSVAGQRPSTFSVRL